VDETMDEAGKIRDEDLVSGVEDTKTLEAGLLLMIVGETLVRDAVELVRFALVLSIMTPAKEAQSEGKRVGSVNWACATLDANAGS
jgi:hypothetical protein